MNVPSSRPVTIDELLLLIGQQTVELAVLRARVAELERSDRTSQEDTLPHPEE